MKQKSALIFESEETVVLKRSGRSVTDFCPVCETEVEMMAPEVLSIVAGSSEREIFRLIEAGEIHFVERGRTYACPECCQRVLTQGEPQE